MTIEEKKMAEFSRKVKNDTKFYCENFLKIRNKKSKLVNFKFNSAQLIFKNTIDKTKKEGRLHRYIVLKARQMGISTVSTGMMFQDTATHEYVNTMIIAHEDKATQNLFNMSKLYYDELPPALKPLKKYSNEKALVFENPTSDEEEKSRNPGLRSKITVATAGTSETGRSGNIKNLHISELAFFPNPEKTMTALLQCVPDELDTIIVVESTANGVGGYFYDMWMKAVSGESDYIPIFLPWFTDPEYKREFESDEKREAFIKEVEYIYEDSNGNIIYTDEYLLMEQFNLTYEQLYWRKFTINNKCGHSVDIFHQEYPSTPEEAFIASGRPRFDLRAVKLYDIKSKNPIKIGDIERKGKSATTNFIDNPTGYLKIFKLPEQGKTYCIGADVAEGLITGDYSVGVVIDDKCDVVALWRGHIDPDLFGKILVNLGYFYNEAYIAVESNNHGLTTIKSIINEDYYNLFYSKVYDKINDEMTKKVGWQTNRKTKPVMIDKLAEFVREYLVGIASKDIISEMYTYAIDERGSTNAQIGCHDDCIMALAIAIQAYLEGRGEDFIPEKSDDFNVKKTESFDIPDIIDELFEGGNDLEWGE